MRPLNILLQLLILRLLQTSRNVDKKSKCHSELLLFCILLTYLVLLRTENKYLIFPRQASKSIPKTYMSMDCNKFGILRKYFQLTMRKFMPASFRSRENCNQNFPVKPLFPPRIELGILPLLCACDNHDTTETRMPKYLRRWLIQSQMWMLYVGENYLIDHAKSLCRSIYFLNN